MFYYGRDFSRRLFSGVGRSGHRIGTAKTEGPGFLLRRNQRNKRRGHDGGDPALPNSEWLADHRRIKCRDAAFAWPGLETGIDPSDAPRSNARPHATRISRRNARSERDTGAAPADTFSERRQSEGAGTATAAAPG